MTAIAAQLDTLRSFRFGVEIETFVMGYNGREGLARALAVAIGGTTRFVGGHYGVWEAVATDGRAWKVMSDASVQGGVSCEIVSPILTYSDLDLVQTIVRAARGAGARVNESCGIHVHVDAASLTAGHVVNLASIVYRRQDLLFAALAVLPGRQNFCKKLGASHVDNIRRHRSTTSARTDRGLNTAWYGRYEGFGAAHYDGSRYHALNLHAIWTKGTVEFRLFNSSLHAGKVKAYIQLALALVAQAKHLNRVSKEAKPASRKEMTTLLARLGLVGDEFKTARHHLLLAFDGGDTRGESPDEENASSV